MFRIMESQLVLCYFFYFYTVLKKFILYSVHSVVSYGSLFSDSVLFICHVCIVF